MEHKKLKRIENGTQMKNIKNETCGKWNIKKFAQTVNETLKI